MVTMMKTNDIPDVPDHIMQEAQDSVNEWGLYKQTGEPINYYDAMFLFKYNDVEGTLVWQPRLGFYRQHQKFNEHHAGKNATVVKPSGIRLVRHSHRDYTVGRICWLLMTGEWPAGRVTHINGDKSDFRWCNLRNKAADITFF